MAAVQQTTWSWYFWPSRRSTARKWVPAGSFQRWSFSSWASKRSSSPLADRASLPSRLIAKTVPRWPVVADKICLRLTRSHTCNVCALPPTISFLLSGEKLRQAAPGSAPSSLASSRLPAVSHSRMPPSALEDANVLPSPAKARAVVALVWPTSLANLFPIDESQKQTAQPALPDATTVPSGENATAVIASEWPPSWWMAFPSATFHSSTEPSTFQPPDMAASILPSGERPTRRWPLENKA